MGARGLFSNAPLGRGPAAAFLQGFGFEPVRQKLFFSCTVRSFYERVAPIARRIEIRPGKLRGVRALPLHAADEQEVIRLYTLCLGDFTVPTEVLFSGEGQRAFHPNSPVMVREGRAVGAVLFRGLGGTAEIDAYVVHPDFRKTRLAPLLIARFADAARDLELNRLAFNCYEEVTDTVNLARRMDARTEKVLSHYLLRLDSSP
jgi:GNAT superfamily N-acetyltransferase